MEQRQVAARDAGDGVGSGIAVLEKVFAAREEAGLAAFDVRRIVVALFHFLEHLRFSEGDFVVLKTRGEQRVTQDAEAFVQIFREQVQAGGAFGVADAGAEVGGEKGEALLQLLGRIRVRAAVGEQPAAEFGEPFFAGGFKISAGADVKAEVDERAFVVRHDVGDGAGLELHAKTVRRGRLIFQRRKI